MKEPQNLNEGQSAAFASLARYCLGDEYVAKTEPAYYVGSHDHDNSATVVQVEEVVSMEIDNFDMALLIGYAGTGKTYLINRLVEYCKDVKPGLRFGLTAPTNKAVKVLRATCELPDRFKFGTIHSMLGLTLKRNYYTGKQTFEPDRGNMYKPKMIDTIDVLIVDETSMLNSELFTFLLPYTRRGLKIIFLGDDKQIPPVGEVQSIPFLPAKQQEHSIFPITLDKIVRQAADNPIITYGAAIRSQFKQKTIRYTFPTEPSETGIEVLPTQLPALTELFRRYFCTDEFRKDSDYVKVIAWRNNTVDYFNIVIRGLLFEGQQLAKLMVGEKLIADKPIIDTLNDERPILYTTNEEMEVKALEISSRSFNYRFSERGESHHITFKLYKATVQATEDNFTRNIFIVHEDSDAAYQSLLNEVSKRANTTQGKDRSLLWKLFFSLQEEFANVKYNYCVTAHKSQGSTYQYVFVHDWDIQVNLNVEERNRIRYVAATRAAKKLFVIK